MTAFFARAYEDRVELLTDGATVRPDGTIAALSEKPWLCPNLPIAFAGRGNVGALMLVGPATLGLLAASNSTVDGTMEAFRAELAAGLPRLRGSQMDGIVCAISESAGPALYYFTTSSELEVAPFELHEVGPMYGAGSDAPSEDFAAIGLPGRFESETLAEIGADLFTVFRRYKMDHPNAGGHDVFGIGGHVDLTVVDANGARTERLHTWPEDRIGAVIAPV